MLKLLQSDRAKNYLVCAARYPLVSTSKLRDELLLYNLSSTAQEELFSMFEDLTAKQLDPDAEVNTLSGGQKVLLMCLLALYSPAPRILFLDLWHSLDSQNRLRIEQLLEKFGQSKEILLQGSTDVD